MHKAICQSLFWQGNFQQVFLQYLFLDGLKALVDENIQLQQMVLSCHMNKGLDPKPYPSRERASDATLPGPKKNKKLSNCMLWLLLLQRFLNDGS